MSGIDKSPDEETNKKSSKAKHGKRRRSAQSRDRINIDQAKGSRTNQNGKNADDIESEYTLSLDDEGFECINVIEEHTADVSHDKSPSYLPKKLPFKGIDDLRENFSGLSVTNPNTVTSQSILFERITSQGRKPQNVSIDDLTQDQIDAARKKKLIYRELVMLPAASIIPHVVIINMASVAFFTDLDNRLDVANESNEKRLYRALNNPTSPLYQNASFDWSLRNSQYDIPILSHPSAYFLCVVPSNKFTYGTKCGHSIIGKGKSYFRMIRKRSVDLVTINVDDRECIRNDTEPHTSNSAQSCSYVDLPPYYVEKTIDGCSREGLALRFSKKEDFEAYVNSRVCPPSDRASNDCEKSGFTVADPIEDAICRLTLYFHQTLDKRIPITIVSSKDSVGKLSSPKQLVITSFMDALNLLCSNRQLKEVPPRRKEWIDTLCDDLQKSCSLKGELTLEDMLCLWESPALRQENKERVKASDDDNVATRDPSPVKPSITEHIPVTDRPLEPSPVPTASRNAVSLHQIDVDDIYDNPISKLFENF